MDAQLEHRWSRLRIALLAIPLIVVGTMAFAPVRVYHPAMDSDGLPTYRADGRPMMETDHWGQFRVNWVSYSLVYSGLGVFVWGFGGWIFAGVTGRTKTKTTETE